MRILLLTTYFRPDVAANGVIMARLAEEFLANGHKVTILTSVPHYDINQVWPEYSRKLVYAERTSSMSIYRLYTYVARDKANVLQRLMAYGSFNLLSLATGAALPKHDVMLVPSPPLTNGVIADLIARIRGTPFIYNVQDIWPDVAVRAGMIRSSRAILQLRNMEDYVYRRAAAVTVLSEGFRSNLLAKGVPDEKISVIPNFVDAEFMQPSAKSNPFSIRYGLAEKFVVLYAGNMGFSQGLENVLDAAKCLEAFSDIKFLFVGNGAGRPTAEAYWRFLGLHNVDFLPFQPHEDLPDMYGAADVCLIPLRRGFTNESVPSKLLTIMAAGKPAIASVDEGSETWALMHRAKCGLSVEPENPDALAAAILRYHGDPDLCTAAGTNARRCVTTEFEPRAAARKYLDVMQMAIDGKRHRPEPERIAAYADTTTCRPDK
ncbi:MAG: glycosyltransferase family 4 protein [Silvibacterium sp.]